MNLDLVNRQRRRPVRRPAVRDLIAWLMKRPAFSRGPRKWADIAVLLLDDRGMAEANGRVFRRPESTDAISLAYRPAAAGGGWRGEILVNVERACAEGRRTGRTPGGELALYLAHGLDHLAGASDRTSAQRARMLARERRWLRCARRAGLDLALLGGGDRKRNDP